MKKVHELMILAARRKLLLERNPTENANLIRKLDRKIRGIKNEAE